MLEDGFEVLMGKLGKEQLKELLEDVTLVTDPLGQELIIKAAGPHSPINIEELHTIKSGLRDEALARLYSLEKLGVFKSSFTPVGGRTKRIFSLTDFGRKLIVSD